MPNFSGRKNQDLKNKYGCGYATFRKDDKIRRRSRNVISKEQQKPKNINTITKEVISRPTVTTFDSLISKLDYSYDSLATINIIFDSLCFTYNNSKDDIEQHKSHTRLGEMEKELLAAYDDLCLQVNHLEKDVDKIEAALDKLKATNTTSCSENGDDDPLPLIFSPPSTTSSPISTISENDFNFASFSTDILSLCTDHKQLKAQVNVTNNEPLYYQTTFG